MGEERDKTVHQKKAMVSVVPNHYMIDILALATTPQAVRHALVFNF